MSKTSAIAELREHQRQVVTLAITHIQRVLPDVIHCKRLPFTARRCPAHDIAN